MQQRHGQRVGGRHGCLIYPSLSKSNICDPQIRRGEHSCSHVHYSTGLNLHVTVLIGRIASDCSQSFHVTVLRCLSLCM